MAEYNTKVEQQVSENVITIKNCNNINEAQISLTKNMLNIKFGYNGTGKSTISEAIRLKADDSGLDALTPFSDEEITDDKKPFVGGIPFHKVKVFNEGYIHQYLFKPEGIFSDSYSVLLKSNDCEELSEQISDLLSDLQETFCQDDSIQDLNGMLSEYMTAVNYASGSINKRGGLGEF